jgi:hypothetical protein
MNPRPMQILKKHTAADPRRINHLTKKRVRGTRDIQLRQFTQVLIRKLCIYSTYKIFPVVRV